VLCPFELGGVLGVEHRERFGELGVTLQTLHRFGAGRVTQVGGDRAIGGEQLSLLLGQAAIGAARPSVDQLTQGLPVRIALSRRWCQSLPCRSRLIGDSGGVSRWVAVA
jgi:hypothetical protein